MLQVSATLSDTLAIVGAPLAIQKGFTDRKAAPRMTTGVPTKGAGTTYGSPIGRIRLGLELSRYELCWSEMDWGGRVCRWVVTRDGAWRDGQSI